MFFWFLFEYFKPNLFYRYFFESLRKQKLRASLLNIYVFNLINFKLLCTSLATFFNTQKTFQRFNVAVRVIWRRNVAQCQINLEIMLCMSTLKFTTPNNVRLRQNNAVFNVDFHNIDQRRNVDHVITSKTSKREYDHFQKVQKSKRYFWALKKWWLIWLTTPAVDCDWLNRKGKMERSM